MSRKDYRAIAAILNDPTLKAKAGSVEQYKAGLVSRLSLYLMRDNDRFNSARFRAACYGKDTHTHEVE